MNALIVYPYERPQGWSSTRRCGRNSRDVRRLRQEKIRDRPDYGAGASEVALPSGFNGYQSGDENYLFQQMCAIWYVLQQTRSVTAMRPKFPVRRGGCQGAKRSFLVRLWPARRRTAWRNLHAGFDLPTVRSVSYLILKPNHMFWASAMRTGSDLFSRNDHDR